MVREMMSFLKSKKLLALMTCVIIVLSYGFYATHYTVHIDQLVSEYYNGTVMIGAGRWAAPMIHWLTNWMNFSPFWHTGIMAILLFFASIVWLMLMMKASKNQLPDLALIGFSVVFVSYPVIEAQLTYPILNIALAYGLVPLSLILVLEGIDDSFQIKKLVCAGLLLLPAVDMYESFAAVYLVGLLVVVILKYFYNKSFIHSFKNIFLYMCKAVAVLAAVVAFDLLISKLVCLVFCGTTEFWYANNTAIIWLDVGLIDNAVWLCRTLLASFAIGGGYSHLVFQVCGILLFLYFLVRSISEKTILPLLLFFGIIIAIFSLSFVVGYAFEPTQNQTLAIFVAFTIMFIIARLPNKRCLQVGAMIIVIIVVLNQSKTINNYAVANYERYTYETELLEDIGEDLLLNGIEKKPVAFYTENYELPEVLSTPRDEESLVLNGYQKLLCLIYDRILPKNYFVRLSGWYGDKSISSTQDIIERNASNMTAYHSFLKWADSAENFYPNIYRMMARIGYNYKAPTPEGRAEAEALLLENDDSVRYVIQETDSIIIVQLMTVKQYSELD